MWNIAICDDEPAFADQATEWISQIFGYRKDSYQLHRFESGTKLLQSIDSGIAYDLYILDLKMQGDDGIALGNRIRAQYDDNEAVILYMSSYPEDYYKNMLNLQILGFLEKPLIREIYEDKMMDALERLEQRKGIYYFEANQVTYAVPKSRIAYLEVHQNTITIWFYEDGSVLTSRKYSSSLKKEQALLPPPKFVSPNRSCIVNLFYVTEIHKNYLLLPDKREVPIGRDRVREIQLAIHRYRRWKGV